MEKLPLIVNINQNSLDDGPGIRSVLFFKGCSLDCVWCQNPETKNSRQELIFQPDSCINCNPCTVNCSDNSFHYKLDNLRISWEICNQCNIDFQCSEQCPADVFEKAGKYYEISDLVKIITSNRIFYNNTGGGVTLSGGEPLLFPKYVRRLVEGLKKENINICIETAGQFVFNDDTEFILRNSDLIYYDIKLIEPVLHQKYCGIENERIIFNFKTIISDINPILPKNKQTLDFKKIKHERPILIPRIPLIPDISATEDNLLLSAEFFKNNGIKLIDLLEYNPLWHNKAESLGKKVEYARKKWMDEGELKLVRDIFIDFIFEKFSKGSQKR
ncbi:MAG: glycyl-radical enzyme activating protein [Promethearchaeota archaeon]